LALSRVSFSFETDIQQPAPWDNRTPADPYKFKWALYDLNKDWSRSKDVAKAQH